MDDDILKSDPDVPVAKVCVAAVNPFKDVIAAVTKEVHPKAAEPFVINA